MLLAGNVAGDETGEGDMTLLLKMKPRLESGDREGVTRTVEKGRRLGALAKLEVDCQPLLPELEVKAAEWCHSASFNNSVKPMEERFGIQSCTTFTLSPQSKSSG